MPAKKHLDDFVRTFLAQIDAEVNEEDGVLEVRFPPGRKRRYGRVRHLTLDPEHREEHVEILEPGSPFLKRMVEDAEGMGSVGVVYDSGRPDGTIVFTFQMVLYSSLHKRTEFLTVTTGSGYDEPHVGAGMPDFVFRDVEPGDLSAFDPQAVRQALDAVEPAVRAAAREFARPGVEEAHKSFQRSAERVRGYFRGLREESFRAEAKLRKRLGEIQSKLYFTEDGLREIKLEKERERLTQQLRKIKQVNTEREDKLHGDEGDQLERQRRRHAPQLTLRLVGATVLTDRRPRGSAS
jgi:hypothetical protein